MALVNPQLQKREQDALLAYMRLLEQKGAEPSSLSQRAAVMMPLLSALAATDCSGEVYRDKVDEVLESLDKTVWPQFLSVAREFYYFWMGDFKKIAAMSAGGEFDTAPLTMHSLADNLQDIWKKIEGQSLTIAENWPLQAYSAALRDEGADKQVVETRIKIARLVVFHLRGEDEKTRRHFRTAVDTLLPLFKLKETRHLFLLVVREFFYFWIGDPDAATQVDVEGYLG